MKKKRIVRAAVIATVFAAVSVFGQFAAAQEVSAAETGSTAKVSGVKAVSVSHDSVRITWKRQKGATGYQVYCKQGESGKYRKVVTTKKLSAVHRKLVTGKPCQYKVRAYRKVNGKTKYGRFSAVKKAVPTLAVTKATVAMKEGKVSVSWGKVAGAKGYQIYRAEGKNGRYKKVCTTGKQSFTDVSAKAGVRYYYKVRAYKKAGGKTRYGAFSSIKSIMKKAEQQKIPQKDTEDSHKHEWSPVYGERTVNKTEKKFYAAICNQCSLDMSEFTEDEIWEHILGTDCGSFSTDVYREVKTARKEKYISGYACSCGAEKQ